MAASQHGGGDVSTRDKKICDFMSMNFKITKEEELTQFHREEAKSKKCKKATAVRKRFSLPKIYCF